MLGHSKSKSKRKPFFRRLSYTLLVAMVTLSVTACNPRTLFTALFSDKNEKIDEPFGENQAQEEAKPSVQFMISQRERNFSVEDAAKRTVEKDGLKPLSTVEIASITQPTVVAINTKGFQETIYGPLPADGAGSGVIISEDGYIVTNNHVTADADSIDVILATGETYPAKLIGESKINDLAVIKIKAPEKLPFAIIGNSDDLLVGELAVAVGNPLGDFHGTVTAGIISSLDRTLVMQNGDERIELRNLIQTDAAINAGNSGGGLFNSYGELIGINVAKIGSNSLGRPTVEGLGFAIPTNVATPVLNALVNEGYVEQPVLNIVGSNINDSMASSYGDKLVVGVWVREISKGSNVEEAGLQVGDIIVAFDGEEVTDIAQLNLLKNRHKPGEKVTLKFFRSGDYKEISFVLEAANQNVR